LLIFKGSGKMKVAVNTGFLAKGDVNVYSGQKSYFWVECAKIAFFQGFVS
jgi:hypothetical protein